MADPSVSSSHSGLKSLRENFLWETESRKGRLKITGLSAVPYGTVRAFNNYPGLTSWATLSRPCGTQFRDEVHSQAPKAR